MQNNNQTKTNVTYNLAGATALGLAVGAAGVGASTTPPPEPVKMSQSESAGDRHAYVDERYLDAKVEAVEARTETKFAQLLGELKVIGEKISGLDGKVSALDTKIETVDTHTRAGKREIIIAVVASALAVAALAWAGVQIFQSGLSLKIGAATSGAPVIAGAQNDKPQTSD